jgi:hypothetical protein
LSAVQGRSKKFQVPRSEFQVSEVRSLSLSAAVPKLIPNSFIFCHDLANNR